MRLIGSTTSPYVRRIRLLLARQARDYTFTPLNITDPSDREYLSQYTPVMKLPVLIDGDQTLYDSRIIARYLCAGEVLPVNWQQENLLTLIDAVNDSLVVLYQSTRSGLDVAGDPSALIIRLQQERIERCLNVLATHAEQGDLDSWDYPAICLYTLLDWASFRGLLDLNELPALQQVMSRFVAEPGVEETAPQIIEQSPATENN